MKANKTTKTLSFPVFFFDNSDPTTAGCPHTQAHVIEIILTPNFRGGKVGVETRSGGYRDCWMRILHNRVINMF